MQIRKPAREAARQLELTDGGVERNPARWSGHTRDWSHIGVVTLNPERDMTVSLPVSASHTQRKAV